MPDETKTIIVLPGFLGKEEADKVRTKIEAQRKARGLVFKMPQVEYQCPNYDVKDSPE